MTTIDTGELVREAVAEADRYNGWPNRETWNTHLWMSNDEGLYLSARQIATEARTEYDASRALRDWWDELFAPADSAGPLSDAWQYAMARTDWYRVAEAFRDEDEEDES